MNLRKSLDFRTALTRIGGVIEEAQYIKVDGSWTLEVGDGKVVIRYQNKPAAQMHIEAFKKMFTAAKRSGVI
nr:hypothetical protein 8 [Legionellales bacterium]